MLQKTICLFSLFGECFVPYAEPNDNCPFILPLQIRCDHSKMWFSSLPGALLLLWHQANFWRRCLPVQILGIESRADSGLTSLLYYHAHTASLGNRAVLLLRSLPKSRKSSRPLKPCHVLQCLHAVSAVPRYQEPNFRPSAIPKKKKTLRPFERRAQTVRSRSQTQKLGEGPTCKNGPPQRST